MLGQETGSERPGPSVRAGLTTPDLGGLAQGLGTRLRDFPILEFLCSFTLVPDSSVTPLFYMFFIGILYLSFIIMLCM